MLPCKAVLTRKITETRRERSVFSCTCLLSCLRSTSEDENSGLLVYLQYLCNLYLCVKKKWKHNTWKWSTDQAAAEKKNLPVTVCLQPRSGDAGRKSFVCLCTCHRGADWLFKENLRIHLNLWQSSAGWFFFFFYQGEDESASLFSLELQSCSNSRLQFLSEKPRDSRQEAIPSPAWIVQLYFPSAWDGQLPVFLHYLVCL